MTFAVSLKSFHTLNDLKKGQVDTPRPEAKTDTTETPSKTKTRLSTELTLGLVSPAPNTGIPLTSPQTSS